MMTLQELKENSIRISGTIVVCWPQHSNEEEVLNMNETVEMFSDFYSMNNSVVCFVSDGAAFVTPYTREAEKTLCAAGMSKADFYVPFSNWDYPKFEKEKWERLNRLAMEAHRSEFEMDCADWCDKHGIGKLSDETMKRCFRIPYEGVPVCHPYLSDTVYPACGDERCVDCTVIEKLGRYCTNNNRTVFVYRDGHTYVTKGVYSIVCELRRAGYTRGELFVPFSNGEQIADPCLAAQWDAIK